MQNNLQWLFHPIKEKLEVQKYTVIITVFSENSIV